MNSFLTFCLEQKIIVFDPVILKSGRQSPYFFNSGLFYEGRSFSQLISHYGALLSDKLDDFDMLFGPAYKGISLVSAISAYIFNKTGQSIPFCYNRKEEKNHGEGGAMVGAKLKGRVLIVDDVISAGTTLNQHVQWFSQLANVSVVGLVLAFDRMERIDAMPKLPVPLYAIANAQELAELLRSRNQLEEGDKILDYLKKYPR